MTSNSIRAEKDAAGESEWLGRNRKRTIMKKCAIYGEIFKAVS